MNYTIKILILILNAMGAKLKVVAYKLQSLPALNPKVMLEHKN